MASLDHLTWEAPGPGAWELETTHFSRPMSTFMSDCFRDGFVSGFQYGTARYGLTLDHIEPVPVNRFTYTQPRPFGAPPGATKPPPKAVLWALARLHPGMRARLAECGKAFSERRWRDDLHEWDTVDKPNQIEKYRAIQAIDVSSLSDAELVDHVRHMHGVLKASHGMHHKYTVPSTLVVGDFLAGAAEWTGLAPGQLLGLMRGRSDISRGFGADELEAAAKAIATSGTAIALLEAAGDPRDLLAALSHDPQAGPAVAAYLEAVRHRCVAYDVSDVSAGEMPDALLGSLRAAVAGSSAPPAEASVASAINEVRERVPEEHRAEFDERLGEARLVYRLRDERDAYSDGWATGLTRRALLEAGRRLAASGKLADPKHAVELTVDEVASLLSGGPGPSADEVVDRYAFRENHSTDDAPEFLGDPPSGPPDPSYLPPAARRGAIAVDTMLFHLFAVPETPNTDAVLTGLAVNEGVYEGTARLVLDSSGFGRIQQGDVLITRNTSPYFNVILPLLGALVTDRGGQLSHAAIVAREYGIPGIVGTREATAKIADGARVRVDGGTGEVHILG